MECRHKAQQQYGPFPEKIASGKVVGMADNSTAPKAFSDALAKLVSVPRVEMQKRLAKAAPEKVSKHKKFKYIPSGKTVKPA